MSLVILMVLHCVENPKLEKPGHWNTHGFLRFENPVYQTTTDVAYMLHTYVVRKFEKRRKEHYRQGNSNFFETVGNTEMGLK